MNNNFKVQIIFDQMVEDTINMMAYNESYRPTSTAVYMSKINKRPYVLRNPKEKVNVIGKEIIS